MGAVSRCMEGRGEGGSTMKSIVLRTNWAAGGGRFIERVCCRVTVVQRTGAVQVVRRANQGVGLLADVWGWPQAYEARKEQLVEGVQTNGDCRCVQHNVRVGDGLQKVGPRAVRLL